MTQVIKLSDKAADRIKEILSENKDSLGVRIGVKSGGCAGKKSIERLQQTFFKYRVFFIHCHTKISFKTHKIFISDDNFVLKMMVTMAHFDICALENIFLIILVQIFM